MIRKLAFGLALILAGGLLAAAPAGAAKPAAAEPDAAKHSAVRLVWTRAVDSDFSAAAIVIGDPNGKHVRALTHPASGVFDIDAQISPHGKKVLYEQDFPDGSARIGLVNSDGSHDHLLNLGCGDTCLGDLTPAFTPDGRHVIWTRVTGPVDASGNAASAVLWKANLDGSHRHRFSQPGIDGTFEDYRARFAPGGYLIFERLRDSDMDQAVFRMTPNHRHIRRLTPWALDADIADISPAKSGPTKGLVVFETYGHGAPKGRGQAIATVPAACRPVRKCTSEIRKLTPSGDPQHENFNPSWDPDGVHIAFTRFVGTQPPKGDIWMMRWNGKQKRPVSQDARFEFREDVGVAS
jgi:Tol biopolymer transport system component